MGIYDIGLENCEEYKDISEYKGKVLLIVNTATGCGLSPQLKELETLYQKYKSEGFEILAFPCNQFLNQEKLKDEEILTHCQLNYGVTFKIYKKTKVNGTNTNPLYKYLKTELKGTIKWNFTKFLIDKTGNPIKKYPPTHSPLTLSPDIEKLL